MLLFLKGAKIGLSEKIQFDKPVKRVLFILKYIAFFNLNTIFRSNSFGLVGLMTVYLFLVSIGLLL